MTKSSALFLDSRLSFRSMVIVEVIMVEVSIFETPPVMVVKPVAVMEAFLFGDNSAVVTKSMVATTKTAMFSSTKSTAEAAATSEVVRIFNNRCRTIERFLS